MIKRVPVVMLQIAQIVVLVLGTALAPAFPAETNGLVQAVGPVGITVSNMDRAVVFYSKVLSFEKVSDTEYSGAGFDGFTGLRKVHMRVVRMRLEAETIHLTQYLSPAGGRSIPKDSRSNDLWFQHIAIIVSDMDKAYQQLEHHRVRHVSTTPQTIPKSNPAAAGIAAYKFQDPDGHNLELLHFPPGKGDPRWQGVPRRLFLGIDHTAIAVDDTETSLAFYRDTLGFRIVGKSLNIGIEQERLDNLPGARVRITGLRAGSRAPGIEFLEYLSPSRGRPAPEDAKPNDIWTWQTQLVVDNAVKAAERVARARARTVSPSVSDLPRKTLGFRRGLIAQDPDGHNLWLVEK